MGLVTVSVRLEDPPLLIEHVEFASENPFDDGEKKLAEFHGQYRESMIKRSAKIEAGNYFGVLLLRWQDETPSFYAGQSEEY